MDGELDLNLLGEQVGCLLGIPVDTERNITVTDCSKHCVYIFAKNGKCLRKHDDEILIADTNNSRIQQINIQTGTAVRTLGKAAVRIYGRVLCP